MMLRVKGYIELAKNIIAIKNTKRTDYMLREKLFLERIRIYKLIDIQKEFKLLELRKKEKVKEIEAIPIYNEKQIANMMLISEVRVKHYNLIQNTVRGC